MEDTLIMRDDDILSGLFVFAGTRVPVKTMFDYLRANHPLSDFLDDFPTVTCPQAQAVLELVPKHYESVLLDECLLKKG